MYNYITGISGDQQNALIYQHLIGLIRISEYLILRLKNFKILLIKIFDKHILGMDIGRNNIWLWIYFEFYEYLKMIQNLNLVTSKL